MKFISHLKTVMKHRQVVRKLCFKLGLYWQGLTHDLSKYSLEEFILGVKYYQGYRSPHEGEREDYGYSKAWMHHKGRNKHHFEYWNDVSMKTKVYEPVEMPIKYVKEMFCDRIGASKIYKGKNYTDASAFEYFERGNAKNIMHPKTAKLTHDWLEMLKNKGEDYTFDYIKKNYPN